MRMSKDDPQPYLQQKSELEADERQKHELEARQSIFELDSHLRAQEIQAGVQDHREALMRTRQEMGGGEHSQELTTQEG